MDYTIDFKEKFIGAILRGEKTRTTRAANERWERLKAGDRLLILRDGGNIITLRVAAKHAEQLTRDRNGEGEIPLLFAGKTWSEHCKAEGGISNEAFFKDFLCKHQKVFVIEFVLEEDFEQGFIYNGKHYRALSVGNQGSRCLGCEFSGIDCTKEIVAGLFPPCDRYHRRDRNDVIWTKDA